MRLTPLEKRTFILLMLSTFFNGLFMSLGGIQDIISKKALHALDWQLTLLAMVWPVANFTSIWWGKVLEQSRHKSRYFLLVAFFGRLVLVLGLWIVNMNQFLLMLVLMYSFSSLLIPATNAIYQDNISTQNRGKLFGYTVSLGTLIAMIITYLTGRLLDIRESSFHMILFATGISGCISALILSLVRFDTKKVLPREQLTPRAFIMMPIRRALELLRTNHEFSKFERNFSVYGMGFIMMQPVLPIYMVQILKLNYTYNFLAKGILSQLGVLLLSPFLGKLHDRYHPHRYTGIAFGALAIFPLLFLISGWMQSRFLAILLVNVAFVFFGVAMTAVNISWNMGTIFFAGEGESSMYQSVHVTMTGIRGILAPLLGLVLSRVFGIMSVFFVAFLFLAIASYLSFADFLRLRNLSPRCQSSDQCIDGIPLPNNDVLL